MSDVEVARAGPALEGREVLFAPSPRPSYAGFVWTLIRTDFKARYHGTIGGFLWALLKPTVMFLVLSVVFSFVIAAGDSRYRANLLVGLFLWEFFAEATKVGIISLHQRGYLLTKSAFPRSIVVLTSMSNAFITLLVFTGVVMAFLLATGRAPSPICALLFVLYSLALAAVAAGIALGGSVLFLHYRDLNQVWDVVVHAGFFVAPVIYPLEHIPERYHLLLYMWLPTPAIQFARAVLVDGVVPSATAHVLLAAQAALVLLVGSLLHKVLIARAVETL